MSLGWEKYQNDKNASIPEATEEELERVYAENEKILVSVSQNRERFHIRNEEGERLCKGSSVKAPVQGVRPIEPETYPVGWIPCCKPCIAKQRDRWEESDE